MPKRTIQPSETITVRFPVTKVEKSSGASIPTILTDASDTSYIRRAQGTDATPMCDLGMGTVTIPADEGIVTLMPYLRMKMASVDKRNMCAQVGHFDSAGSRLSYANSPVFAKAGPVSAITDVFRDRPVSGGALVAWDGKPWSQESVDNATLAITDEHAYNGSGKGYVYEAAIDVYSLVKAAATLTGPSSPVVTTTFPAVTIDLSAIVELWQLEASSHLLTGTGVWVRIFTAADAAAPGFDPETASALAENRVGIEIDEYGDGVTASTVAVTVPTTTSLPDSVALKVYALPWRGNYDPTVVHLATGASGASDKTPFTFPTSSPVTASRRWALKGDWVSADLQLDTAPPTAPSITATEDPATGRVALAVTAPTTAGFSAPLVSIRRSSDSGSTWQDVIGAQDRSVTFDIETVLYDYDCPAGDVIYQAQVVAIKEGYDLGSAWSASAEATYAPVGWNLKVPQDPARNMIDALVTGPYDEQRDEDAGVFRTKGATTPTIVAGDLGGNDGTLAIVALGASVAVLRSLLAWQGPIYLEDAFGGAKWIRATSRKTSLAGATGAPVMTASVDYLETSRPEA